MMLARPVINEPVVVRLMPIRAEILKTYASALTGAAQPAAPAARLFRRGRRRKDFASLRWPCPSIVGLTPACFGRHAGEIRNPIRRPARTLPPVRQAVPTGAIGLLEKACRLRRQRRSVRRESPVHHPARR